MKILGVRKLAKLVLIALLILVLGLTTQGLLSITPCVSSQTVPEGWADFEQQLKEWAAQQETELDYADGIRVASPSDLEWRPWLLPIPAQPFPQDPTGTVGGIATLPDKDILAGLEAPCP